MHERRCLSFILGAALLSNTGALAAAQDAAANAAAKGSAASESPTTVQEEGKKAATGVTTKSAANASAVAEDSAEVKRGLATLKSGTAISTELDQAVDAGTAKPGDLVFAKVTKDVKRGGRTVINKGDHLLGRITSVDASTAGQAGSELGVTFDRMKRGDAEYPLNTVVSSIISSSADMGARDDMLALDEPMIMPRPAPASGGSRAGVGGGLVGSATSTVGSAASATGSAAGGLTSNVGGTATSAIGSAGSAVGASEHGSAQSGSRLGLSTPARDIRLNSRTSASQTSETTSMLGARRGNLRLESGTRMKFKVSNQTSAETSKK